MRRGLRFVAPPIFAAWLLGTAAVAFGHAELESADPPPNSTLPTPPAEVVLSFSEPVDAGNILVELSERVSGSVVGLPAASASNGSRRVAVAAGDLAPGVYLVRYRAVSAVDGHVIEGRYAFQIDPTGTAPPLAGTASSQTQNAGGATVIARWVAQAAALMLFGGAVFWMASGRPALRERGEPLNRLGIWRLLAGAAFLSFAGLGIFLAFGAAGLGTTAAGAPHQHFPIDFAGPFGWTPFAVAMRVVEIATFVAVALSTAWFTAREEYRRTRAADAAEPDRSGSRVDDLALTAMVVLGAVALGGYSAASHAAANGGAASALVDWAHQLAVGVWLGTLPALVLFLVRYARDAAD
ncbi:MAG: copper resistance protein CopC, partial [Chloroflexota bacterium]|nr:copper resistance protein CopC [Chloroflexota bacterium]